VYENPDLKTIQGYCQEQVGTLWDEVLRFENPHNYYVDLSQALWDVREKLLMEFSVK
jgi:nicotinate phosphoribosyltransferase